MSTGDSSVPSLSYASLGRRFLAWFLDALILAVPCAVAAHALPVLGGLAVWFFYAPIFESSETRATLGKYLMSIQVTDLKGGRISLRAALIRNLLKCLSTAMLFVGYFFALFTERKQSLHDLLVDTVVINGREDGPVGERWLKQAKAVLNSQG